MYKDSMPTRLWNYSVITYSEKSIQYLPLMSLGLGVKAGLGL